MKPAFIHPTAALFGSIELGEGSSIWPFVSVRAEIHSVQIGNVSNIQDFGMIHIGYQQGVTVGDYCTIAHRATLHGCIVEDACLIGVGATIMDGCIIGRGSIVAGHSFLKEGTVIPPFSIVAGTPAAAVRHRNSTAANIANALLYRHNALAYSQGNHRSWTGLDMSIIEKEANVIAGGMP